MKTSNLVLDAAALAVYLLVANPVVTGVSVHEWIALGLIVILLAHVSVRIDRTVDAVKGIRSKPSWARAGSLVLNLLILAVFATVVVSGLMVSGAVLPLLGLYAPGYYFWDPLHAVAAKLLLALLFVHVASHGKLIAGALRRRKGVCDDGCED